jgi:hypothetical protein
MSPSGTGSVWLPPRGSSVEIGQPWGKPGEMAPLQSWRATAWSGHWPSENAHIVNYYDETMSSNVLCLLCSSFLYALDNSHLYKLYLPISAYSCTCTCNFSGNKSLRFQLRASMLWAWVQKIILTFRTGWLGGCMARWLVSLMVRWLGGYW